MCPTVRDENLILLGVSPFALTPTGEAAGFYASNYEIVFNARLGARSRLFLGSKGLPCRFCGHNRPQVTFQNVAHAIPELTGNKRVVAAYECDGCNGRFGNFEDDLAKSSLPYRTASQVRGKRGVPSFRTDKKLSRIDVDQNGFVIVNNKDDPIVFIDETARTMTFDAKTQPYRPLGVFKALVKTALSIMDEADVGYFPEALRWLLAPDVTTNRIDDGTRYTCFRSFTPGPGVFADSWALLLRRRAPAPVPFMIFVLGFGNQSYQIVVPCPRQDRSLINQKVVLRAVPVFPYLSEPGVKGTTRYWTESLASEVPSRMPARTVFHYDHITTSV